MTAHFTIPGPLTRRAFDARVAQLADKGFHETEFETDLNGGTVCFAAFFDVDPDNYGGMNGSHEVCAAKVCALAGAWCEDQNGDLYAGSREEIAALVGEKEIARWERHAEEGMQA